MTAEPDSQLLSAIRRGLGETTNAADVARQLREQAPAAGSAQLLDSIGAVAAEVIGAGPLEELLDEPGVSDILVNGHGPVWVDRGRGPERTAVVLPDEASVRRLAQRLVNACGRRLDDAQPFADARLADGTRLHAVLPPLAPNGTHLSLRLPPRRTFSLDDLVAARSLSDTAADLLRAIVDSRIAFVVTGGTGTGKTTILSTLLSFVDPGERIVLVEDASELRPQHPHVVRLESRLPNAEGAGGVDLSDLVRQALRMRPDRLVVGEVRGREVVDLLAALNTGHEGGCSTIHANRTEHVPARFEALGAAAGLPRPAVHSQLAAAVDAVVHLRRDRNGARRVCGIAVLIARPDGLVEAAPAFAFGRSEIVEGPGADELRRRLAAHA